MDNKAIAKIFYEIADILEIKGEDRFRINAYRRAAQTIESLAENLREVYKNKKLEEIPGIGKGLAEKIEEILKTGKSSFHKELIDKIPHGLLEILRIEGVGPKLVQLVYKKFKVRDVKDLEHLCKSGKLEKVRGFGPKKVQNILQEIALFRSHGERELLANVLPLAENIVRKLKNFRLCEKVELAGSLRRKKETIGDIDILATTKNSRATMDFFCSLDEVKRVKAKGATKANVVLKNNMEADLRVLAPKSFGAALVYFTGSKEHNIKIRERAIKKGLKINEYGVWRGKKHITGATEEEVYKTINLPWFVPEIREDRGEVEAADKKQLPKLIELKDICGDLHIHSDFSDGENTMEEIIETALRKKYKYIAITDHASPLGIIHGLEVMGKIAQQAKEIEKMRQKFGKKITIFHGVEVDILPNGKLCLPDLTLKKLDFVIAAIHSKFKMTEKKATERILKALKNPYVKILGHPTGRLINRREGYPINIEKIAKFCAANNKALELNAFWNRLDLNDINCKKAISLGAKIAIGTDAHNVYELENMAWGVYQARRGWVEKKDVINAWPVEKLKRFFGRENLKY